MIKFAFEVYKFAACVWCAWLIGQALVGHTYYALRVWWLEREGQKQCECH